MNLPSLDSVNWTLGILGISVILVGAWRSKSRQRLSAGLDALIGREEVTDRSGKVIVPAQPGAMHRLETMEAAVTTIATVVTDQRELRGEVADLRGEVADLRGQVRGHDKSIALLAGATAEKAALHQENAAFFDMVAKRDSDVVDEPTD